MHLCLREMVGQYATGAPVGEVLNRYGPWSCCLLASLMSSAGYGLFAWESARTSLDAPQAGHLPHFRVSCFITVGLARSPYLHRGDQGFSLSYEEETKKVIVTVQELGVSVAAYSEAQFTLSSFGRNDTCCSPLGRGFLTGQIKSVDNIPMSPE